MPKNSDIKLNTDETVVVVLIPHFNNLAGLENSIKSISFSRSLTILIVDDGSDITLRPTSQWISQFEEEPGFPIKVLNLEQNKGIEAALNDGLSFILENMNPRYIARLDAGDVCHPDRFDLQCDFLDGNEDIFLLGSWVEVADEEQRKLYTLRMPLEHKEIRKKMQIAVCFIHPSVMFRTSAFQTIAGYPNDFPAAEDYALFYDFVKEFKTANIGKTLVRIERRRSGISASNRRQQLLSRMKIIWRKGSLNWYSSYGLIRTSLLLIMPYELTERLKTLIK